MIILFQTAFNVQQLPLSRDRHGLDIEKSVCRKKALLINLKVLFSYFCPFMS